MSPIDRPSKKDAFLAFLQQGWTTLHLDARRAGVVVPPSFRGEAHLVLQYGHDLPIPIPDFEIDDYGVRATLSFSRTSHRTVVPWSAVYAVAGHDDRAIAYESDLPSDVAIVSMPAPSGEAPSALAAAGGEPGTGGEPDAALGRNRFLTSVPADAGAAAAPDTAGDGGFGAPVPSRRRRRPQLRLVK